MFLGMHMAFDEVRFPTAISRGATGGSERRTEIVTLGSGHEERNTRWVHSRRSYNAGFGVRSLDDVHAVVAFFEERRGRLHGFRWKDHADFKSCAPQAVPGNGDQTIGIGDGAQTVFQLVKSYGSGLRNYSRTINKPVAGSVLVAVNALPATPSVDHTTGLVTFASAPAPGAAITAGFEFDVPARFETDRIAINLASFQAGEIPEVPIVELRL
jgi:uncharacterized protein (TIGR02217 family)